MPRSFSPTKLAQLVHDLAGPLTALSMCYPEVQKQVGKVRGSHIADKHLDKCAQLCGVALEETMQKLKKLQQYVEVYEVQKNNSK
jgi:hypothetical protein